MAYEHKNSKGNTYYLHTVKSRAGKDLFYFCKRQNNKNHKMIDVPAGFTIVENSKTNLPCLKKQ